MEANNHLGRKNDNPHEEFSHKKGPRGISWPVKAVLLAVAGILGLFAYVMKGWGEPVTMAAAALVVPILLRQFREFWSQRRFWITVALLAVIQVPLVIAVRRPIEQAGRLYSLAFAIIDTMFVGATILLVCSKSSGESSKSNSRKDIAD